MENKKISLDDILNEETVNAIDDKSKDTAKKVENSKSDTVFVGVAPVKRRIVEDLSEIAPMPKPVDPNKEFEDHYYGLMDKAIERTKKSLYEERIKPWQDKCKELALEAELNGEEEPSDMASMVNPTNTSPVVESIPTPVQPEITKVDPIVDNTEKEASDIIRSDVESPTVTRDISKDLSDGQDIEIDPDDFGDTSLFDEAEEDLEDSVDKTDPTEEAKRVEEEANQKRLMEQLKGELSKAMQFDKINFGEYSIGDKKVSINKAMSHIAKETPTFNQTQTVPLYETGRTISFTPLSGSDIVKMSTDSGDSRLDVLKKTYSIMYAHDASINKNEVSFTMWMKTIAAGDLYQLYFGLYKATFAGSNYIAYKCPKCDNFFMVKKDIKEMYEFNEGVTEEQKARMKDIEDHGEVEDNIKNKGEMFQVSDNYVVLIHPKTLYNTLEMEHLDTKFRNKYAAIINVMQYIDKLFYIDKSRKRLIPVDLHPDPESMVKTIKNKCIIIHKFISSITVEQYSALTGKLASYNIKEIEASNLIEYHIPEQVCTESYTKEGPKKGQKCTHKFKKEIMSPYAMLFTQHQLYINTTLTI